MSAETERARAIASGARTFHTAFTAPTLKSSQRIPNGIAALLEDGWVPPAQRNEEQRQISAWQCDARRAFEHIESLCTAEIAVLRSRPSAPTVVLARLVLNALGDRFRTPEVGP